MKNRIFNKRVLSFLLTLLMIVGVFPAGAFAVGATEETQPVAESTAVAKVGNTEYATIDEAIANWTNNTTLTLLADVTLSDVIELSSTEHHILDLGTYTMTAASRKDAIQIVNNGRSSASYTLDIKADATNPGGITANGKAVVRTTGKSGVKDRPIIRFYNGVFTGTYVVNHNGSSGTNCPQFQFHGGVFNGTIYTNRALNQFYGGTFNGSLQMSVDTSAYTLIAGGTFAKLSNLYGSTLNSEKFTIGSGKSANNGSVCIDENGYYVITTSTPTNAEASVASNYNSNNYFYYSTVNTNGMYYEDVYDALEANKTGTVTVFTDELDLEGSSFTGTIVVPAESTLKITNAPANLKVTNKEGKAITPNANGSYTTVEPKGNDFNAYTGADGYWGEVWGNASESFVIKLLDANGNVMGTSSLNNIGGIINGNVNVTWNLKLGATSNTDEYWTMSWTTAPSIDNMPAKVELWVDGVKVSGGPVVLHGPDEINKIVAAVADSEGKILNYATSLQTAIDAGKTTVVLTDVTESITSLKGNIVSGIESGVTITGTSDDWVYCGDNFTIGEGVTFKTAYMFAYCKNGVINGKVVLSGQLYMRYAGTKLTVNAPGSLVITGENAIVRYMDGDAEAGLYINGDNDDTTVEFKAPYISFYSGIISAKDAVVETGVLWMTNSTDSAEHGMAYLKLDNTKLNMTVNEHTFKADDNSKIELVNGSEMNIAGKYQVADSVVLSVDNTSSITAQDFTYVHPVAQIVEETYTSLEAAFAAAAEGDTITLLADAAPALTSQRAITKASVIDLNGKTLTLTEDDLYFGTTTFKNGTIVVDPSVKPSTAVFWMFANQTLTFDGVKLVATGVTGTYLIGLDGNNSDLNLINGSEILVENTTALDLDIICVNASTGNDILVENSKVNVKNLDGRVFFRGNYTISGNSDIDLSGITKAGFRIEAGQTLTITDTATVDIVGEPRDGGIHLTALTATYTKADTATVNATVIAPEFVATIGDVKYATLQDAIGAAQAGDKIVIIKDISDVIVNVDKDLIITGSVTLNNIGINANGADVLTVSDLTFTGNSWINSGTAEELNVYSVTANVTPNNASYTNSRSAFISLGRSEGQQLALTVEHCNIVSLGGSDPILGWAKIASANIIGNTFGSAASHQNYSDSVKFMSVAEGAVLTFNDNTVYSDYNGIVIAQNTTRSNSYVANFNGNTFIGAADHIWIEISGASHYYGKINASSDNTVNGNAFTAADIKIHTGVIKTYEYYAGVDVVLDGEGKVIGGSFAAINGEAIAEGYKLESGVVKVDPTYGKVAMIGENYYATLADAVAAAKAGDEIVLLADVAEDVTVPAGVIFNGNGKQVGVITAAGEITFKGHTKATNFGTKYTNTTINIIEGACLEITGTGRLVIGHGCTFNIEGNITDAKTADKIAIQPSLIVNAGASFTGKNLTFNITNAYVKFNGNSTSKNSNANGTFNFNINNSIWEQTGVLAFYVPTSGMDPTFNFNLADSVLTSTSHLVFDVTKGEIVFDNSNVNVGVYRQLENLGTLKIVNGSVVWASVQTSSNAKNPGTTIVDNATYVTTGTFGGSDLGIGKLILKNNAVFSTVNLAKVDTTIDATIDAREFTFTKVDAATTTFTLEAGATLTAPAGLTVTTVEDYKVVFADGVYSTVARVYIAEVNGVKCETMADIVDTIEGYSKTGIDAVVKFYNDITINKDQYKEFAYGTGNIIFTADVPVTVTLKADFDFVNGNIQIKVEKNVTLNVYDNAGGIYVFYGPGMYIEGTVGGGQNWGCLYLAYGKHTVAEDGKLSIGRVHMAWTELAVNGEIDSNYLLVEESTLILDGALVDANYITDTNNGGLRYGASNIFMINGTVVTAGTMELKHANSLLTMDLTASLTANKVQGAGKIVIDVADFNGNAVEIIRADMSGFTGTVELINNNDYAVCEITSTGVIVKKAVASIGNTYYTTLQAAINAAYTAGGTVTITLLDNVTEKVTVDEKVGFYLTIDGADKEMNGNITVNPLSDENDNRRITIEDINFVNASDTAIDFISAVKTNHYPRLSVLGCSFTGNGKGADVAVRTKTAYDLVINDCTGTGLHSFLQNTAGLGITIEEVTVSDSKSGLALGTVQGVTVKGCNIDVAGYGIRLDANTYNNNATIESNNVKAFIPVVVRKANADSNITFAGENTMTATNTDDIWMAVGTSEYEENGKLPTVATGKVIVTVNDTGLNAKGIYGNYGVASVNGVKYVTLADAVEAAKADDEIVLLANATVEGTLAIPAGVTIKSNGYTVNGSIRMLGNLTLNGPLTITGGLWVGKSGETLTATLSGDKLTASYFMFQRGTYTINADIDAVYGYLSFEGTFEVNSKITTSNTNGEPLYINGNVNLNSGASFEAKNVWLSNENTVLNVKEGASVTVTGKLNVTNSGAELYSAGNISGTIDNSANGTIAIFGGTYTQDVSEWCADGYTCEAQADGTYGVRQLKHLIINVGSAVATMALDEDIKNAATMDEAVALAKAAGADYVTYKISGAVELTTGGSHGILDLGKNVIIEGVTSDAKLTIVGGGVPDIKGVTFKNITLADEGTYLPTANEFMYQNYIDCTFDGVTFEEGIRVNGNTTITKCTINSSKNNQYALWSDGGKVTMTGTTVNVDGEGYGMVKSDKATEYVLKNNTFEYKNEANKEVLNTNGAKITASGNTFIGCDKGIIPEDKTNYAADGTSLTAEVIAANNMIAVAEVNGDYYGDIQEAIKAAAPSGTVELLADVTVDKWITISETLTIGDGSIITLAMNGLTINGNGHTITINEIESPEREDYLFHNATNLNIKNLTIKCVGSDAYDGGISLKSGTIENVTFEGGKYAVVPGTGYVTVTGCTFNGTKSYAIYYESARDNLVVTGNTFNTASGAYAITMRGAEKFTNNTINTGRVNLANSAKSTVTGNCFGDERFKVYNGATANISENKINNLVFNDGTVARSTFTNNTLSDEAKAALIVVSAPLGDVNGDRKLTSKDVVLLRQYVAELPTAMPIIVSLADVNGDGEITSKDVVKLRQIIAENS